MNCTRFYFKILALSLCFYLTNLNAQLVINEFCSKNESGITDEYGETADWIELFNSGDTSLQLGAYALSDDEEEPQKWTFPDWSIEPGEHLLIFASGKDTITTEIHTNFAIKSAGETLLLSDTLGMILDSIPPQSLSPDQTYGRTTDGSPEWSFYLEGGTPGYSNNVSLPEQNIDFSHESGHFQNPFGLSMVSSGGATIHYTINGTEPTNEDLIFQAPIEIASREGEPNVFSNVVSTELEDFVIPSEEIFKINTIRARAFVNGEPVSKIYTKSYLVDSNPNRYQLPIISLVTDPYNFFDDETGIYVPGNNYNGTNELTMNCFQDGMEWERPVHFEYIDTSGTLLLSQDAGVRIHGGGSRRKMQKSLRLYARSEYGESKFEHPFFIDRTENEYKRLVLRAQHSSNTTFMADEVAANLARELEVDYLATRPVIVFLNGEFWGMYNLRERMDNHYLKQHYGANEDSISLLENNPEITCCDYGDNQDYLNFITALDSMDMSQTEAYAFAEDHMDVDNYLNYLILQFYIANHDWPGNNLKFWKSEDYDSKWRWIMFDADFAFRKGERKSITNFMNNMENNTPEWGTILGQRLLENPEIKARFIELFEYHLNHTFSPENISCHHRQYGDLMAPHITEYFARFFQNFNYEYWTSSIEDVIEDFASIRACAIQEQILQEFGVSIQVPYADCPIMDGSFNDCADETLAMPYLFEVDLKVCLEGVYDATTGQMENYLLNENLIPLKQPYHSNPWNYNGNENIGHLSSLPQNAIDWVLVEARIGSPSQTGNSNMQTIETQAGILLSDGNIVDANTGEDLRFRSLIPDQSYYFVIRHRNHLDIISAEPILAEGELEYDFREAASKAFGSEQQKIMSDGTPAMYTADFNGDGLIQTTDYDLWFANNAVLNTYQNPDANLDGLIQNTDYDAWFLNKSKIGTPDIQY